MSATLLDEYGMVWYGLFTDTSAEYIRLLLFSFPVFSLLAVGSVTYVSFWKHVKLASFCAFVYLYYII